MQIDYCCTYWGSEDKTPCEFLAAVLNEGYTGIEVNLADGRFNHHFLDLLNKLRASDGFKFIAQQVLDNADESVDHYIKRMKERLEYLMEFRPDFINAHTGKDFFRFDDNCRVIDEAENLAAKFGIPVLHETHRGRFSFHLATLQPYLRKFPNLQLTGDFSHWCCVSESLLQDQQQRLEEVIPHIAHIHARIGSEQAAQVNNPFAPEWNGHMAVFVDWWKAVIAYQSQQGSRVFTITPEFGPAPYMPEMPYSREPLANQWETNARMKDYLKLHLS